jgi:hypothetical protein
MIGTAIRFLLIVLVAVGVPFAWFQDSGAKDFLRSQYDSWTKRGNGGRQLLDPSLAISSATPWHPQSTAPLAGEGKTTPVQETPAATLDELLRFDITDSWVLERWPRVSTILSNPQRKGLRVPLVTGSKPTDLAGALSYYFDENGRVQRISFQGHTGDASQLVRLATQRFQMRTEPNLGAGLYLTRWNGFPTNGLRIRHAAVVRHADPLSRLEFFFEVNRPDIGYSLSPEFVQHVQTDHRSRQP